VLDRGRIQQVGHPMDIYNRPGNLFVATFIGSPKMNVVDVVAGETTDGLLGLSHPDLPPLALAVDDPPVAQGSSLKLGVRPNDLQFDAAEGGILVKVGFVERHGDQTIVNCETKSGLTLNVAIPGNVDTAPGNTHRLGLDPARCHLFADDGRLICRRQHLRELV
jgi:multiple sugar transport system ATP-binding protein